MKFYHVECLAGEKCTEYDADVRQAWWDDVPTFEDAKSVNDDWYVGKAVTDHLEQCTGPMKVGKPE